MTTHQDLTRLAGVSTATVPQIMHGRDRAGEPAEARAQKAIEEPGYIPGSITQSLSPRQKEIIGIIRVKRPKSHHDDVNLGYDDDPLGGVIAQIRTSGLSLLVTFWDGVNAPDVSRLDVIAGKVDGILIGEGSLPSRLLERLAGRVPVVMIAGPPDTRECDVVTTDDRAAAAAIVTHLVREHGSRRLFYLGGPVGAPDTSERQAALQQVLRHHPHSHLAGAMYGSFGVETGAQAAALVLSATNGQLPDAIMCANDQMAIDLLRNLAKAGVRVPRDVAVVGFGDTSPGRLTDPPLTTVHQPMRMIGMRAYSRLIERIAVPSLPQSVELLPTELVIRSSCGCPPGTSVRQPVRPAQE
jgi:LacI family transcriptional regulator